MHYSRTEIRPSDLLLKKFVKAIGTFKLPNDILFFYDVYICVHIIWVIQLLRIVILSRNSEDADFLQKTVV